MEGSAGSCLLSGSGLWFAIVEDGALVCCGDAGFKFRVQIVVEAFGLLEPQFSKESQ